MSQPDYEMFPFTLQCALGRRLTRLAFTRGLCSPEGPGRNESLHTLCVRVVSQVLAWADTQGHDLKTLTNPEGTDALIAYMDAIPDAQLMDPSNTPKWADYIMTVVDISASKAWSEMVERTRGDAGLTLDEFVAAIQAEERREENRP